MTSQLQQQIINDLLEKIDMSDYDIQLLSDETVNTHGLKCSRCGSDQIHRREKQTRSADEATTQFLKCLNCGNRWRKY